MNKETAGNKNLETERAFQRAVNNYTKARKAKVPHFAKEYFSSKGALRLNSKAFGTDLYKAPINVAWAMPYAALRVSSSLLKRMGFEKTPSRVERIPAGFETNVQKQVNWLIFTELLELPYVQGNRKAEKDALLEEMLNQPEISSLFIGEFSKINSKSRDPRFRPALERNLMEYSRSRTAAADLAGNIISLSAGAGVLGQITPGAMSAGGGLAAAIAQHAAISNFTLGPTLGGLYYSVFPASASMGLVIASTGTVMAALAILTSFSGIITDPIQYKLGLHQKKLNKLIDSLQKELKGVGDSKLKLRDMYVARIFDLLDLMKKAARTLS
jgi:hypothetical protein